jgi:hypothetical protein
MIWYGDDNMPESDEISWQTRARVPDHVLFQEVAGQAALLHLQSELYFGLDDVGTMMWKALVEAESIEAAAQTLIEVYDAAPERIRGDLIDHVHELKGHGLVKISS